MGTLFVFLWSSWVLPQRSPKNVPDSAFQRFFYVLWSDSRRDGVEEAPSNLSGTRMGTRFPQKQLKTGFSIHGEEAPRGIRLPNDPTPQTSRGLNFGIGFTTFFWAMSPKPLWNRGLGIFWNWERFTYQVFSVAHICMYVCTVLGVSE